MLSQKKDIWRIEEPGKCHELPCVVLENPTRTHIPENNCSRIEIGEPKRIVDWMNVGQKYEILSISAVMVRMQDRDRPVEQPIVV